MSSASDPDGPPLVRLSTAGVEARLRPQLLGDVMARQLAGGVIERTGDDLACDWQLAAIGPGTVIATAEQVGLTARRDGHLLRDGDDDVSIFFGRRGEGLIEQNDRRVRLAPGEAVVVAHGRAVRSWWPDTSTTVLRVPRAILGADDLVYRAGGLKLDHGEAATRLLGAYVEATWAVAAQQSLPPFAARHLAELAALAIEGVTGRAARPGRGAAVHAGRVAAMREVALRNLADPRLTMAKVARAIGVSERAGYLAFEAAGIGFTDFVMAARLDRARERLAAGYAGKIVDLALAVGFSDLSHFNRRFRNRFGATPSEVRRGR